MQPCLHTVFVLQGQTSDVGGRTTIAAGNALQVGTDATNGNGARLTNTGLWANASSRENKEQMAPLDAETAIETVNNLAPVTYAGKQDQSGERHVGFVAEDVPELVAMNGRDGIAAIEVVAVVTRVVKEQQKMIESQKELIAQLGKRIEVLETILQL